MPEENLQDRYKPGKIASRPTQDDKESLKRIRASVQEDQKVD